MIRREFEYKESENYGTLGWLAIDAPSTFDPGGGQLVAHDMLEHMPDTDDSLHHECMALGGVIFVRGETGMLGNIWYTPAEALASDIVSLLSQYVAYGTGFLKKPPRTYRLREEWVENMIVEIRQHGIADTLKELERYETNLDQEATYNEVIEKANWMADWMRIGYRRTYRRYEGWRRHSYDIGDLFRRIKEEVDAIRHPEEGERMIVRVSPKNLEVSVQRITLGELYPEEEY